MRAARIVRVRNVKVGDEIETTNGMRTVTAIEHERYRKLQHDGTVAATGAVYRVNLQIEDLVGAATLSWNISPGCCPGVVCRRAARTKAAKETLTPENTP